MTNLLGREVCGDLDAKVMGASAKGVWVDVDGAIMEGL